MNYKDHQTGDISQLNPFNMIYWSIANQNRYYNQEQTVRPRLDLSRKGYDNTLNQLPNTLDLNVRPYGQLFQLPSVKIYNRDVEYNGRDRTIFKQTDDVFVNVSGVIHKAKDIPKKPLIDEKNYKKEFLGLVK
jgi:hypothetical protein